MTLGFFLAALGVRAVFAMRPQTSLDPREMRAWIPNVKYGHSAFGYKNFEDWLAHREVCERKGINCRPGDFEGFVGVLLGK